jgi:pheromone shutdown protein TraB
VPKGKNESTSLKMCEGFVDCSLWSVKEPTFPALDTTVRIINSMSAGGSSNVFRVPLMKVLKVKIFANLGRIVHTIFMVPRYRMFVS